MLTTFDKSTPAQNPAAFGADPIFAADACRTPTLIMVGNPDHGGVPTLSSEIFFSLLRSNGVPARLVRLPDEGQTAGSAASSMYRYSLILDWLRRFAPSEQPS